MRVSNCRLQRRGSSRRSCVFRTRRCASPCLQICLSIRWPIIGRRSRRWRSRREVFRAAAPASRRSGWITAGLAIVPLVFSLSAVASVSLPSAGQEWQAFNLEALPGLIADGNTVLVDVTATWCLTCKVNELRVLENAEVRSRFQQLHVIRTRADWSRPNPLIANYLRRFGRYGIPFDVVYGPGRPQGEALTELLTTSALLHAIDRASVRDDNRKSSESAP